MRVLISFVVPVYNIELITLKKCIESIKNVKIPFEVIIINDGSLEELSYQYEEYLSEINNCNYIKKNNEGVSVARNIGIKASKGEYVYFLDSDDTVLPDLVNYINEHFYELSADWIIHGIKMNYVSNGKVVYRPILENKQQQSQNEIIDVSINDVLKIRAESSELNECWGKFIRRSVIEANKITFPAGIIIGEDLIFNTYLMSVVDSIQYLPIIGYEYNFLEGKDDRLFKEGLDRFDRYGRMKNEFDYTLKRINSEEQRNQLIKKDNLSTLDSIFSTCLIYQREKKFDRSTKNYVVDTINKYKILQGVTFKDCKSIKNKLAYVILKYNMWWLLNIICFLRKIINRQ